MLRWRSYLVDMSSDFKTFFFCIGTMCVFEVNDRWNSYFVVLIGMGRCVALKKIPHYIQNEIVHVKLVNHILLAGEDEITLYIFNTSRTVFTARNKQKLKTPSGNPFKAVVNTV